MNSYKQPTWELRLRDRLNCLVGDLVLPRPCPCSPFQIQMTVLSRLQFPRLGRWRWQNHLVRAKAGLSILFVLGLFFESLDVFPTFDAANDGVRGMWRDVSPAASVKACPAEDDEECPTRYAYVGGGNDINCKQSPLDDEALSSSSSKGIQSK